MRDQALCGKASLRQPTPVSERGPRRTSEFSGWESGSQRKGGRPRQQFLLLRVLWFPQKKIHTGDNHKPWHAYISTANFEYACKFLKELPCWKKYLDSVTQSRAQLNSTGFAGLETFSLVRHQQLAAQGAPPFRPNSTSRLLL